MVLELVQVIGMKDKAYGDHYQDPVLCWMLADEATRRLPSPTFRVLFPAILAMVVHCSVFCYLRVDT